MWILSHFCGWVCRWLLQVSLFDSVVEFGYRLSVAHWYDGRRTHLDSFLLLFCSYKWAEVLSADAFGAFEEAGLDNEEAVRETGKRFASTVLALGGGRAPELVFEVCHGGDWCMDAPLQVCLH